MAKRFALAEAMELRFSPTQIFRIWTGGQTATLGGQVYQAGAISAGGFGSPALDAASPLQVTLGVATEDEIGRFIPKPPAHTDPGPIPVVIRWFLLDTGLPDTDDDYGVWKLAREFEGRASLGRMAGGVVELTVAARTQDAPEGSADYYSHADQTSKHPGDRGLEYARQLSVGDPYNGWPPR